MPKMLSYEQAKLVIGVDIESWFRKKSMLESIQVSSGYGFSSMDEEIDSDTIKVIRDHLDIALGYKDTEAIASHWVDEVANLIKSYTKDMDLFDEMDKLILTIYKSVLNERIQSAKVNLVEWNKELNAIEDKEED